VSINVRGTEGYAENAHFLIEQWQEIADNSACQRRPTRSPQLTELRFNVLNAQIPKQDIR
jgi:hypothetical protein